MIRNRLGIPCDETAVQEELTIGRLGTAAMALGWRAQVADWNNPADRERLEGLLLAGMWVMVDVLPGPMTMLVEQLRPMPISRHGPLMLRDPEDKERREDLGQRWPQLPHHAIVLVEAFSRGFRYLDPWYPAPGQPFTLRFEDFYQRAWTGRLVVPRVGR